MKALRSNLLIASLLIVFFVLPMIFFTVDQGERAIVIRLGDIHTTADATGKQQACCLPVASAVV